jgi:N-acetylglucosaminyldiphosphoundecaprenol N-acetyl-beta-D-mannosaminyltransferase
VSARVNVLTTPVLPVAATEAAVAAATWAADGVGRVVCAANVHMVMEAWDDAGFAELLAAADLVVCDGRPLVWTCRLQGVAGARQARGLDVMQAVCERAARRGLRVGLYGAAPGTLEQVRAALVEAHSGLDIVYAVSPPFRPLTAPEDEAVLAEITATGVQVLFVGLGCPKQEHWMMARRGRLGCVMLGVGAAFDMLAGEQPVAPRWVQRLGMEWVLRLACEPRRLWRRYALHNGRFVLLVARQLLRRRG